YHSILQWLHIDREREHQLLECGNIQHDQSAYRSKSYYRSLFGQGPAPNFDISASHATVTERTSVALTGSPNPAVTSRQVGSWGHFLFLFCARKKSHGSR
ncbi:MAG TPA: hypothetical protein VIW67_15345, partial [Terriglobales bacterium]